MDCPVSEVHNNLSASRLRRSQAVFSTSMTIFCIDALKRSDGQNKLSGVQRTAFDNHTIDVGKVWTFGETSSFVGEACGVCHEFGRGAGRAHAEVVRSVEGPCRTVLCFHQRGQHEGLQEPEPRCESASRSACVWLECLLAKETPGLGWWLVLNSKVSAPSPPSFCRVPQMTCP